MNRRSCSSVVVAVLLLVAACGQSTPTDAPTSSAAPVGASPSTAAAGSSLPSAPPMAAGPAWTAILDEVDADGHVSKDTALQAFALATGADMPGVTLPAGDPGTIPSGSMALRWLVSYWDDLTPEQQAAAIAAVPELGGLPRSALAPGGVQLAVARPRPSADPVQPAVYQRSNAFYTQLAKEMVGQIALLMADPIDIGLQVKAHAGLPQKSTSGMETGVFDANGGIGGKAATCDITVSPLGDAQTDVDVQNEMAHEVWHCYEGAIVGPKRYASQNPAPWIMEGEAEWVGATLVPDAPLAQQGWWDYLDLPDLALFSRTYSAIGFYGHLGDTGTNPWTTLVHILEATSNDDAFAASGANVDPFLDSWASSYLDDAGRGAPWHMTGPALAPTRKPPDAISVPNDGMAAASAPAFANAIALFTDTPDVLETTFAGRARLSDTAGHDYLADDGKGTFCMLPTGCTCPGASPDEPPMLALDGSAVALAVTGGPKGSTGTLKGTKLDDYCAKGITGTWDGIWQNAERWGGATGGFTLTVVQKGGSFTGTTDVTGPTCVRHGKVTGTVSADGHISMGWIAAGVRDVAFDGTLSGKTMSGTWSAFACQPADLQIDGSWSAAKRK